MILEVERTNRNYHVYLPVTGGGGNCADAEDGGSLILRPRLQYLNAVNQRWQVWRNLAVARLCRYTHTWAFARTASPVQWDQSAQVGAVKVVTVVDQREHAPVTEDQRERFLVRVAAAAISPEVFPALHDYTSLLGSATEDEVSAARQSAKEEAHAASACAWARDAADLALEVIYDNRQRPRRVMDWAAALTPVDFASIAGHVLGG